MKTWLCRAAAVVLLASLAAGCTSVRSNLGTSDSSCYLALPTASKAVGGHGHLVGVKLFTLSSLHKEVPRLYVLIAGAEPKSQRVCVTAFTGQFTSQSVLHPRGRASGHLAVVVTTSPANKVLGTAIYARVPLRLTHSHIG